MITFTGLFRININRNIRNLMRDFFKLIKAVMEKFSPGICFLHLQIFGLMRCSVVLCAQLCAFVSVVRHAGALGVE